MLELTNMLVFGLQISTFYLSKPLVPIVIKSVIGTLDECERRQAQVVVALCSTKLIAAVTSIMTIGG